MGVDRKVIKEGNGIDRPKPGDNVTVHYICTLDDTEGKEFDSSINRGKPFSTVVGVTKVIKGWDEGVSQMSLGEKAVLTITSDHGYGERGFVGLIPGNATLCFQVELLEINNKKAPGFK